MIVPPTTVNGTDLDALRRKHTEHPAYGAGGAKFAEMVRAFCIELKATTALDYACGKGMLADMLTGDGTLASVHRYDVGIEAFSTPCPAPVDVAICNHALYEFSARDFVAAAGYLRKIAKRGAFISFQWGDAQGGAHWADPSQDADWVYGTLRQYWPCHRMLDTGPTSSMRQFVFMGFVELQRWP